MIKPDSLKPTPVLPFVPAKQTPAGPVPVINRVPTTTSSTGQQQRILRQNRPSVQRPLQNKRQTRPSVPTDKYAYSAQPQAEPSPKKHSDQLLAVPPAPHPAPLTAPRQQNVSSSAVGFSSKTPERPSVIKLRRTEIATNNSSSTKHSVQQAINDANAVAFGLTVARSRCEIKPRTTMWLKAQSAISLLRRGHTREEAARRSGVPLETLAQLIKWGQQRP